MITSVGKILEEEKESYVEKKERKIVERLLARGIDIVDIAEIVEDFSISHIRKIKEEMN